MSKKKNTLKDLDEFLKQQAATLVAPASLSEKVAKEEKKTSEKKEKRPQQSTIPKKDQERLKLCDMIIETLEAKSQLDPEDMMLINSALYIKHGADWKDAVRAYWKGK
jgi:hypothetical protein